ncbi:TPA: hypothetical protein ACH3X1_013625 [Trebouxia sp. C0004]
MPVLIISNNGWSIRLKSVKDDLGKICVFSEGPTFSRDAAKQLVIPGRMVGINVTTRPWGQICHKQLS